LKTRNRKVVVREVLFELIKVNEGGVGFLAGGPVDIATRVMADWFSSDLGQQFVVEDRGGMGGNLGAQAMINSSPDGYTLLLVGANNAISASLYKKLPFNFIRDTVAVAGIMRLTNIMVVPPTLPVKTVADFIAYAKANPGKVSFASSGNGTSVHMSGELFKAMTGVEMVHVPYRGSAGAYPDLMTGKVDVMFDNLPGAIEFVRSGQLRAWRHRGEALAVAAGCACSCRNRSRLRDERVVRHFSAQRHDAGDRRDPEQVDGGGPRRP
jgi:tripartite-type tricarboxylate transporter receptor subunit TctC